MTPLALEPEKSMPALGNSNVFPQKKRHASGNLSSDYERLQTPQFSASINIGFENVEPATRHAPRQHKRRRLVT
jgi:hypothetical protein